MSVLEQAARSWAGHGGSHDAVVAALTKRVQELEQLLATVREHATTAERSRLREKVEGLVGFWDNHPSKRLDGPERRLVNEIFGEVLALLDKPEGSRP